MKRFISACLALASAASASAIVAASRPHYGGTLRLEIAGVVRSVDPAAAPADSAEAWAKSRLTPLAFETLTTIDPEGGLQPGLATSWEPANGRWRFRIRRGVLLHDGSPLQAWQVAASLRSSNPSWSVDADGDLVIVDRAAPDVPWELSRPRNGIAIRSGAGTIGTGPFRVDRPDGNRLQLRAHDRYWNARPFLDAVQIEMGRAPADQLAAIERGAADVVTARPIDLRRLSQRGLRTVSSRPLDLVAIVFEPHRATAADADVRAALADAVDRQTLCAVLLQGEAEPASALVPPWLSGYMLPALAGRAPARAAIAALPAAQRSLVVRIDAGDAVAQAIADRVVVDARESGLGVTVQSPSGLAPRPDFRIVRVAVEPSTADRALAGVMAGLGLRSIALAAADAPPPPPGAGVDVVYRTERALLEHGVIVPLVHVPDVFALGDRVHVWNGPFLRPSGVPNLADVWIE